MDKILKASTSPHKKSSLTTKRVMIDVLIALLPALIVGIVFFGAKAALVVGISLASAILTEWVYLFCTKKKWKEIFKQFDFSSAVTGLLLGLSLSSSTPWYVVVLSAVFSVAVVKMLFGGTGKNLVNPAITGRVFAFIAFQSVMVSGYLTPAFVSGAGEVFTGATPLRSLGSVSNWNLFLGLGIPGAIGETSKAALLLGFLYLAARKIVKWYYPLLTIAVCGILSVVLNGFDFTLFLPSILSGGLFLGALFMATDYVTSPKTLLGNVIYFIVLGALIAILRKATGIEVVSFAILLMNLLVPLFDRFIRPKPFGTQRKQKAKEEK